MPKKTARPAKTSQQKAREEQWRRRVSAQGLAAVEDYGDAPVTAEIDESLDEETVAVASSRTVITPTSRQTTPVAAGRAPARATQPRRAAGAGSAAARASRLRPAAQSLSMEEEMYYVRSDIRRLIILTAICLAVLIALSFVLR